jgi:hypothetical protein
MGTWHVPLGNNGQKLTQPKTLEITPVQTSGTQDRIIQVEQAKADSRRDVSAKTGRTCGYKQSGTTLGIG